jgi:hypothetical protein
MTYEETRDNEQLRILDQAVDKFIEKFKKQPSATSRQTVIFFPGGLASKLLRAKTPYRSNVADQQTFKYNEIWLNLLTFVHPEENALKLKMHKDQKDRRYHDEDERIIVADGSIELEGITPYDDFIDWCEDNKINLFVFGWDWRRPLEETVTFFLKKFLPQFRKTVMKRCNDADPLENFTLVGHSFGGMVVNLILRESETDPLAANMKRAITVATPFYGYGGQIHRWFEGIDLLNHLNKKELIRTLSSLPACYTLNWLDEETFDKIKDLLNEDPELGIKDYPSNDRTLSRRADPYHPQDVVPRVRYPRDLGFKREELLQGLDTSRKLTKEMPDNLARKFFNIRGVQVNPDNSVTGNTIINTTWDLIDPDFDPDQKSPITDGKLGAGDEVLPAWSTHLVTLPPNNRRTVKGVLHHSFIMASTSVQDELAGLLGVAPAARTRSLRLPEFAALEGDYAEFVRKLQGLHLQLKGLPVDNILNFVLGGVAGILGMFSEEKRKSIVRRIIVQLCK